MARVVVEGDEPNGLAQMFAGLVEATAQADPSKDRLLESARGAIQVDVPDAGVTIGLKFVPGCLTVTSGPVPGADVRLTAESAILMSLCTASLRFGLPDLRTEGGRALGRGLVTGQVKVRGTLLGLPMMFRLNRLMSVGR